jgi:hypothetical protein
MSSSKQICIVCLKDIPENDIAPHVQPGDPVICISCDLITPNRQQARDHWLQRLIAWERLKKIEAAAQQAYQHLSWLDQRGSLTREEQSMIETLRTVLSKEEENSGK